MPLSGQLTELSDQDRAVLREALELLEPHVAHRDTGRLHDPLYLLLSQGDLDQLEAIRTSLLECDQHPAIRPLRRLLGYWEISPRPELTEVIAAYGPVDPLLDPVEQAARHLARAKEVEQALRSRILVLENQKALLDRTTNGIAAAGAIVAVFALLGWLIALGGWELSWTELPSIDRAIEPTPDEPMPDRSEPKP